MFKKIVFILFMLNGNMTYAASVADSWIQLAKSLKESWNSCPADLGLFQCLKDSSLDVFDKIAEYDIIPLTDAARLVRHNFSRKISFNSDASVHNNVWKSNEISKESWTEHILMRLLSIFRTHTLNIDILPRYTGRARHRNRNQMLPMMAFGMTAVGLVMVPMGFQFLAVLAGKALLLSKMALLLAAINGLKKVASSGVHYGLYHADPHVHHWDRGDQDHPRSQNRMAANLLYKRNIHPVFM